jgi:hypothetical protein
MRLKLFMTSVCMAALSLGACTDSPSVPASLPASIPPVSTTATPVVDNAAVATSSTDQSVPAAETVLTPAKDIKLDPAAGRVNTTMTKTQESTAMPLPGQANDHSAPLPASKPATLGTPSKPASGP